jgi:hypothetical protein
MLIRILKTHHRALDPRTTVTLYSGEVAQFEETIANSLIKSGFGVEHKQLKTTIENKAIFVAPENKVADEKLVENQITITEAVVESFVEEITSSKKIKKGKK